MNNQNEAERKRELYEKVLAEWNRNIATWEDFFNEIDKRMRQFQSCGCPIHTIDAIYWQYAFMVTLRDNPDEGDIKKLIEYMCRIAVYDSKNKLGFDLGPMSEDEVRQRMNVQGLASHAALGGLLNLIAAANSPVREVEQEVDSTPQPQPVSDKKKLH